MKKTPCQRGYHPDLGNVCIAHDGEPILECNKAPMTEGKLRAIVNKEMADRVMATAQEFDGDIDEALKKLNYKITKA